MSGLVRSIGLVSHEFRYCQKVFWRNPGSVFFTVLFPVLLLIIFATIFGDDPIDTLGGLPTDRYYVPAIVALAVISATFTSLAMNLTIAREEGLLERGRGTPQPAWIFIAGRVGNSLVVSALMVVVVTLVGLALFGSPVPWGSLGLVVLVVLAGAGVFSVLGIAITAVVPSREAAPALVNLIVLPLYFLSGIFIPEGEIPPGVLDFAGAFPVRPFFELILAAWAPEADGPGFPWASVAVLLAWGALGLVLALRFFRWTPRR
jgi:ABC-2 type transport system permease protein